MQKALLAHINKFVLLDNSEAELMLSVFSFNKFKKKEHLLEVGQSNQNQFFVEKGCLRMYLINERGNEQTTQFAIENWWIADYLGFHNDQPSSFSIQAVEDTEVAILDKAKMDALLQQIPKLEKYFRLCFQKSAGAAQIRIKYLFTLSAEERYHNMNDHFPDFVQRVPQYMLASYLDFSAEFLSKIRAGKV